MDWTRTEEQLNTHDVDPQDVLKFLNNFGVDEFEKHLPSSLRWGYIIPHDCIWIPMGTMMVEKAVGTCHSVTIRVPSTVIDTQQLEAADTLKDCFPKKLGVES